METLEEIVGGTITEIGYDDKLKCYCLIIRKDEVNYCAWIMSGNTDPETGEDIHTSGKLIIEDDREE